MIEICYGVANPAHISSRCNTLEEAVELADDDCEIWLCVDSGSDIEPDVMVTELPAIFSLVVLVDTATISSTVFLGRLMPGETPGAPIVTIDHNKDLIELVQGGAVKTLYEK